MREQHASFATLLILGFLLLLMVVALIGRDGLAALVYGLLALGYYRWRVYRP